MNRWIALDPLYTLGLTSFLYLYKRQLSNTQQHLEVKSCLFEISPCLTYRLNAKCSPVLLCRICINCFGLLPYTACYSSDSHKFRDNSFTVIAKAPCELFTHEVLLVATAGSIREALHRRMRHVRSLTHSTTSPPLKNDKMPMSLRYESSTCEVVD